MNRLLKKCRDTTLIKTNCTEMRYTRMAFRHKKYYYSDREDNKYLVNALIPRYILACFISLLLIEAVSLYKAL